MVKQDWKLYVKSKSSVEKIVEKTKASKPEIAATLKEKLFIPVVKQAWPSITHTNVASFVPIASGEIEITLITLICTSEQIKM